MDITNKIVDCINNKKSISFSKYGDGEYLCAFGNNGHNCDNDNYTPKLRDALIDSFKFIIDSSNNNNYIGEWHGSSHSYQWTSLVNNKIKFARYHTLIFDGNYDYYFNRPFEIDYDAKKVEIYKAINKSNLKKIIICNELLIKSKLLFNADELVIVPFNNWFENQYNSILQQVKDHLKDSENHIVITCCGMSAKVLIADLLKTYPNGIYLDFGSALDKLCTKRESRGFHFTYEYLLNLLKDIIPNEWNDPKYDYIYQQARYKLGLHII